MTNEDTELLAGAAKQLRRVRNEIIGLRAENDRLRAAERKTRRELLIAQTDAEHYRECAEAWKEEARVLRLANQSFAE